MNKPQMLFQHFRQIHSLWPALFILAACSRVAPANVVNTPVLMPAFTPTLPATATAVAPEPTPAPATPLSPTSLPPSPPISSPEPTAAAPINAATPTGLAPAAAGEPVEIDFVETQPNPYWQIYTRTDESSDFVTDLIIDNVGRKWIGSSTGLSVFDDRRWRRYTSANGLLADGVSALAVDPAGAIWVGYDGDGLSRFDGQQWQHYTLALDRVGNGVREMAVDRAGQLWFRTAFDLGRFDGQTGLLYRTEALRTTIPSPALAPPPNAPLIQAQVIDIGPDHPAYGVTGLAVDPAGPIWLTNSQGLAAFDGQQWQQYTHEGQFPYHPPMMVDAAAGQIWAAAASGGVAVFDGQHVSRYNQLTDLPRPDVEAAAVDRAGRHWFGTNAGASVFDGHTWLTYTTADGLPAGAIAAIAVDTAGRVWLATSTGTLAGFTPPASPALLPTPAGEVIPRIIDVTISPTTALTIGDVISVTWQTVGEQVDICFLSGTPNFCRPGPASGSEAITVDESLFTSSVSGLWLSVTGNGTSTGIFEALDFQCRNTWFYAEASGGCPEAAPIYSHAAAQYFEHGLMIWSEQPDQFYIFFDDDHAFTRFESEWVKDPNFLATPEPLPTPTGVVPTPEPWPAAPPPGLFEPTGGFGRVWQVFWRYEDNLPVAVRQDIGWATGPEFAFETAYQCAMGTAAYGPWSCAVRGPTGAVLNFAPQSTVRDRWVWMEK